MMTLSIRKATVVDVPYLVREGGRLHEHTLQVTTWQPERVGAFLSTLIKTKAGVVFIAEVDGRAVGGLVTSFNQHPFGYGMIANEWGLYVAPDARGAAVATELVSAFEFEANLRGCRMINLTSLAGTRAGQLYERLGYREHETHYVKVI